MKKERGRLRRGGGKSLNMKKKTRSRKARKKKM